jgi:perosamine synthetase
MSADEAADDRIPVSEPDLGPDELANVTRAVTSTWISSTGEFLGEFEAGFGHHCHAEHVIPVSNGTVAIHLVLAALGVSTGDEVIVPSMTYIATANAVRYTGATPVFADILSETWCLDPDAVAAAVTPRTVAIIAVHLYGHPADLESAKYKGRPTGSLGDAATFSFYGNKVITSGEGGAVTTNDRALAARLRLLRGQGMDPDRRYFFPVIGYNYRLTNVAAALLCGQLARLPDMLGRRRTVYATYARALDATPAVTKQPVASWASVTPWLYGVLLTNEETRDRVARDLARRRIETRPFFVPIHTLPPYEDSRHLDLPVTIELGGRGLSLPTSSTMSVEVATRVAEAVLDALGE